MLNAWDMCNLWYWVSVNILLPRQGSKPLALTFCCKCLSTRLLRTSSGDATIFAVLSDDNFGLHQQATIICLWNLCFSTWLPHQFTGEMATFFTAVWGQNVEDLVIRMFSFKLPKEVSILMHLWCLSAHYPGTELHANDYRISVTVSKYCSEM